MTTMNQLAFHMRDSNYVPKQPVGYAKQCKANPCKAMQSNAKQSNAMQSKAKQCNAKQ